MDKERDRSGDGAGPVAPYRHNENRSRQPKRSFGLMVGVAALLCSFVFSGKEVASQSLTGNRLYGLSLTVNVGVLRPDNSHAAFYSGRPENANTLMRILHSESYGHGIWNNLSTQDLIGSSIGSYNQLTVAEYGDMYYKLAFQLGLGFRYDLEHPKWAWQVRFDYAKLHAQGLILLNSGKDQAYLTNADRYVNCPAMGVEERISCDLGIIRKFRLHNGMDMELSLGGTVNNTKVESSEVRIAGVTYSILDVWGGQSPSSYVGSYEYVNQGGIGYGGYASLSVGYTLPSQTAIWLGYTFSYNKVNLLGYADFAPHHAISLNVAINNFSFFDS